VAAGCEASITPCAQNARLGLLRPAEVASLLGVSLRSVYRLTRSGELPSIAVLTNLRISETDLDAFIAGHRRASKESVKALRNGGIRLEVSDPKYLK
jgi:excisionase family DNA binding protein